MHNTHVCTKPRLMQHNTSISHRHLSGGRETQQCRVISTILINIWWETNYHVWPSWVNAIVWNVIYTQREDKLVSVPIATVLLALSHSVTEPIPTATLNICTVSRQYHFRWQRKIERWNHNKQPKLSQPSSKICAEWQCLRMATDNVWLGVDFVRPTWHSYVGSSTHKNM